MWTHMEPRQDAHDMITKAKFSNSSNDFEIHLLG